MRNSRVYNENQRFVTWWICVLFIVMVGGGIYMRWTNAEGSNISEFYTGMVIGVLVGLFIFLLRLRSRIDGDGIHIRFFPLVWKEKTWRWDDIAEVYVKKYSPWEYGGWGYRIGGPGIAYTTKGRYGIQIVLKRNGARILLGTQKPEEVREILEHYNTRGQEV